MSRRKEAERLAQDLALKLADRDAATTRQPLTKKEAERIRLEAEARRTLMRENGMRARLAAHIMPWKVALLVAALSSSTWTARWLIDPMTALSIAGLLWPVLRAVLARRKEKAIGHTQAP